MKLPVVAYATGGVPEGILDGQTGFLVPTGQKNELVAKIELLLRNPSLQKQMGEAGRKFVDSNYSLDALAQKHEQFYLEMVKGNQTA